MIDQYHIERTLNLDRSFADDYNNVNTYPKFQEHLEKFKDHITGLVDSNESKTFYKFGDGDYHFLKKSSIGSAKPGNRALSVSYEKLDHAQFTDGVLLNDYYTCEIPHWYTKHFSEVISKPIDYPAEYGYGLVANRWFFKKFSGKIGVIGASPKVDLIERLCQYEEYRDYLGCDGFVDYVRFPQKFACDDIDKTEELVSEQLKKSTANIFLLGIGHAKSAILHRFKKYTSAVFLDVGAGIDAIAGCINVNRPYSGDWVNYRISGYDYSKIDYLRYTGAGKSKTLN